MRFTEGVAPLDIETQIHADVDSVRVLVDNIKRNLSEYDQREFKKTGRFGNMHFVRTNAALQQLTEELDYVVNVFRRHG